MKVRYHTTLFALLIVALLAAACSSGDQSEEGSAGSAAATSTPVPTAALSARPTYTVERGTVEDVFTFTGRWQARDQLSLSFPTSGTIRQVNVRAGDAVSAGDLLADYDTSDLENQLASAQLNLESALSNIDTSETGSVESVENAQISLANARLSLESQKNSSPWTSVASAKLQLESAQRSLDDANRSYLEALSHPENPASSADSAYQQVQSAQQQLDSAQISYSSAAQSYSNYEIQLEQQENAVLQAELALERAIADASAGVSDESVRSAQLNIDQINEDIANASLYAPIDGVVLQVNIATGDSVQAYSTVIVIGLPEPKEVIASLALTDANNLAVGMTGTCQVMNQPATAVGCAVRRIPLNSSDADQTTRVAASLEGVADNQLIEVDIPLEVREDVLWLPPSVIRTFQNRTFVVLQTADGPQTVDVELGLQTDDRVEIVSGVQEGDVVVAP
ncbi:MAG TPA: biotin/lipoyl-binding protein [Aggregatilinea sp.]|uniref:efflux RND transporter periplasmic adaptor subunit n=1 Tax=Aggregatilinea sp. TaxID=2806333 RepID=UPI002BEA0FAB|nr:biotin/lipoyl-binding protein [Aggregatilinea sp.]HML20507.1 biotin/lipoyl-binding protein [Aggregatilinea sp.]